MHICATMVCTNSIYFGKRPRAPNHRFGISISTVQFSFENCHQSRFLYNYLTILKKLPRHHNAHHNPSLLSRPALSPSRSSILVSLWLLPQFPYFTIIHLSTSRTNSLYTSFRNLLARCEELDCVGFDIY